MKIKTNNSNLLRVSFRSLAVAILFAVTTNCTTEETLVDPAAAPAAEIVEETAAGTSAEGVSLTVSGAFIEYADGNLCSECKFVLPEDASVVDGEKLGIEAGDVICLNKAFQYGSVELINVEGAEGNPVVIANCGE